jgi:hypothetical protein
MRSEPFELTAMSQLPSPTNFPTDFVRKLNDLTNTIGQTYSTQQQTFHLVDQNQINSYQLKQHGGMSV